MRLLRKANHASFLWNFVFVLTIVVYAVGLPIDIMEPDAAVYAEVSMEMHDSNNYLEIYHKGKDWLDKPHFPFWLTALSYELLGVNTIAYKLPAVLFILIAAFYTYLFAVRYYSKRHACIAALLLITAQHIIISNQDVRAEPFMTGLTIMALYHLAVYLDSKKMLHLIAGSIALSFLIMTKGLFTVIPVAAAIGLSLLYQLKWKEIFHWQWLVCAVVTLLTLFPALYGYYIQFDQHPEKVIFGQTGVSGVKFFLWTSQWGRFANTGPIKGTGDPFYFIHTLLWAFLPWAFLAFYALYKKTIELFSKSTYPENYTYFGFLALFLIFSFSQFQLSFYLNLLFPFLAILTTAALFKSGRSHGFLTTFSIIQLVLSTLALLLLGVLHFLFLNDVPHIDTLVVFLISLAIAFSLFRKKNRFKKIIFAPAFIFLSVNYYVNREFYPALLRYQSESAMAYFARSENIPADQILFVDNRQSVADVLLHHVMPFIPLEEMDKTKLFGKYVFTTPAGLHRIDSLGLQYDLVHLFGDFPVTKLKGKFLNKKTRSQTLKNNYLIKIR